MDPAVANKAAHRAGQSHIPEIGQHFMRSGLVGQEGLRGLHELLDLFCDGLNSLVAECPWRQVAAPPLGRTMTSTTTAGI